MTADKHPSGRKFDQTTRSGHGSLASVGGKSGTPASTGNRQSDTRTDDLLSGGVSETERSGNFQQDSKEEDLEKGFGKQPGNQQ